jgi:hypothetical protein
MQTMQPRHDKNFSLDCHIPESSRMSWLALVLLRRPIGGANRDSELDPATAVTG